MSETRPLKSISDRLILDRVNELRGPEVLLILLQGTTLASAIREARPDLRLTCFTPEHFFWRTLQEFHGPQAAEPSPAKGSMQLLCQADLPEQVFDDVLFPTHSGASSELAQELLQQSHQRLRDGGRVFVSVNNPRDRWIQNQLKSLFGQTEIRKTPRGVSCSAVRMSPLRKIRGFHARFAFRHGERLLFCESRPGVFSHRRLDGGARALIRSLSLIHATQPDNAPRRIIDMGCGVGAVALAAAADFPNARILAIDSYARAVECTQKSAALNEITSIETLLTSDGKVPDPRTWDLLLGNPPYYSDFRISELFLQTARASLRPGGTLHIVTKLLDWQEARMKQLFANVTAHSFGEYTVFIAQQKA